MQNIFYVYVKFYAFAFISVAKHINSIPNINLESDLAYLYLHWQYRKIINSDYTSKFEIYKIKWNNWYCRIKNNIIILQWQEISNNYKIIKCMSIHVTGKLLKMAIINLVTKNHRTDLIYTIQEFELCHSTLL